ncbi:MAG: NERD domain-containing protein, partial [Neisseriaceae bacterium]|nr:NERD domain-containing protein [Neisseriaceae bacterium]
MEVVKWAGGLWEHEVRAIEKIEQAFGQESVWSEHQKVSQIKGKGLETLKELHPKSQSIFPWKGYAGFRFANVEERKEGEFDLVIVTHCNVLIVELKHWNGTITSHKDKWYLNNKEMGRSPVFITRNKQHLLEKKLDKFKSLFTNKGHRPQVHFVVVMTHEKADFSQLPDNEKLYVLTLKDFLKLKNEYEFNNRFRPHPDSKTLNQDFDIFDKIFDKDSDTVKPKSININGYYAEDTPVFSHPKQVFQEYLAQTENNKHQDQALLRRWDFTKISDSQAKTPDGRYRLVSREYEILNHIKSQNSDLYRTCLNYKSTPQKGEITAEHIDLFELFPQQKRFNQFVGGHNGENLSQERRLGLVQILLDKFAQLHKIGIAHRDLGEHSLWLSADDKISLSGFATAYFPSEETVGDIRKILEVSGDLAKDAFPISGSLKIQITPYQYDVRSLAVLAWHIIQAKWISSASLNEMKNKLADETMWYAKVLQTALSDTPFKNAVEFLEAFNQNKPAQAVDFSFDFAKLEPFTHDINHSRAYREDDDFIVETSEKEIYLSNGSLVKAWLNADPQNDQAKARVVLNWLENMAKLADISPDYVPKIREFGIAKKSGCLFTVSDFIDGVSWNRLRDLSDEQKNSLIQKFIQDIEHLHSLGFTHGDLKPDNVLVTVNGDEIQLYILDILDFSPSGQSQFNTEYSPDFDHTTEKQRDNFAVMKMACELLGMEWNTPSEKYVEIADVIKREYADNQTAFISLSRFKEALTPKTKTPMLNITVGGRDSFLP